MELAEFMFAEKGIPKQDIGKMIVEQYSPTPYSSTAIRNWLPDEYKDPCSIKAYWNYYIGEKHTVAGKNEKIYEKINF